MQRVVIIRVDSRKQLMLNDNTHLLRCQTASHLHSLLLTSATLNSHANTTKAWLIRGSRTKLLVACSPKTDPCVMRVYQAAMVKETFDEQDET
jgi:hypothetical protein